MTGKVNDKAQQDLFQAMCPRRRCWILEAWNWKSKCLQKCKLNQINERMKECLKKTLLEAYNTWKIARNE